MQDKVKNCDIDNCVLRKEFENLLMFLMDNYHDAYQDWKLHLRVIKK